MKNPLTVIIIFSVANYFIHKVKYYNVGFVEGSSCWCISLRLDIGRRAKVQFSTLSLFETSCCFTFLLSFLKMFTLMQIFVMLHCFLNYNVIAYNAVLFMICHELSSWLSFKIVLLSWILIPKWLFYNLIWFLFKKTQWKCR